MHQGSTPGCKVQWLLLGLGKEGSGSSPTADLWSHMKPPKSHVMWGLPVVCALLPVPEELADYH